MRVRIDGANCFEQIQGEASGRVHGHVERNQSRIAHRRLVEGDTREVQALDGMPSLAEPRRGRSQAEGLPAQFVGRDEDNLHAASL